MLDKVGRQHVAALHCQLLEEPHAECLSARSNRVGTRRHGLALAAASGLAVSIAAVITGFGGVIQQ